MTTEEQREKIEQEIKKTERRIEEYREMAKPVAPDVSIGRLSRMDAINNKSVAESALRQAEEKLNRLEYILKLVGTPEFGVCVKCHSPIPLGRILIKPDSIHCVRCAK